ncbi:uncharacterized protein LOC108034397 [Drosophila biarmipes]|uniref:uncharacterized protein LOC108034397 n=1 Tax=Drosophila biarmipes TaxID=125945 RepID=UPI0007E8AC4B|nr:uncharacterized protein LOC108034397 [Drosophila biarmipes]
MNGSDKRARKSRLGQFKTNDKIMLIHSVQAKPILWDTHHERHFHGPLLKKAWEKVAEEVNKDVKSCKAAWKSLRDSYKYYRNTKQSRSENPKPGEDYVEWKFAEHMSFLPVSTSSQRTQSSTYAEEELEVSQDQGQDQEEEQKFSEQTDFMDSKLLESDDAGSVLEEVENVPYHDLSDNNISDSLPTQETNWPSKRKRLDLPSSSSPSPTPAKKMCDLLSKFIQSEKKTALRRPIFGYWESLLDKMPPELADVVEQKMTKCLWAEQEAFKAKDL